MAFTIDYGFGPLGILLICVLAVPAVIVLYWYMAVVRQVKRGVVEEAEDKGEDTPVA